MADPHEGYDCHTRDCHEHAPLVSREAPEPPHLCDEGHTAEGETGTEDGVSLKYAGTGEAGAVDKRREEHHVEVHA